MRGCGSRESGAVAVTRAGHSPPYPSPFTHCLVESWGELPAGAARSTHPAPAPAPACSHSATAPGSLARPAGTAIFEFPGGVELKDAFKARIDEVGAGLGEADVQAVSPLACCGEPPDLPQTFETAAAASLG